MMSMPEHLKDAYERACMHAPRATVLLFLDFDGVLHPYFPLPDRTDEENLYFSYRPRLEQVLRAFPQVQIVIASDWRKLRTLEELRGFFSPDIAARIVGATPLEPIPNVPGEPGRRQRQVERWLELNDLSQACWLALDDEWDNYLSGAHLVRCNDGFRDAEEIALRSLLVKLIESSIR